MILHFSQIIWYINRWYVACAACNGRQSRNDLARALEHISILFVCHSVGAGDDLNVFALCDVRRHGNPSWADSRTCITVTWHCCKHQAVLNSLAMFTYSEMQMLRIGGTTKMCDLTWNRDRISGVPHHSHPIQMYSASKTCEWCLHAILDTHYRCNIICITHTQDRTHDPQHGPSISINNHTHSDFWQSKLCNLSHFDSNVNT